MDQSFISETSVACKNINFLSILKYKMRLLYCGHVELLLNSRNCCLCPFCCKCQQNLDPLLETPFQRPSSRDPLIETLLQRPSFRDPLIETLLFARFAWQKFDFLFVPLTQYRVNKNMKMTVFLFSKFLHLLFLFQP